MKILVINGPNLNFLGIREKNIYGTQNYDFLLEMIAKKGEETGSQIEVFQSNHEGAIIDRIQDAYFDGTQGIVINPGAYTHYSYAIHDALASGFSAFTHTRSGKTGRDWKGIFRRLIILLPILPILDKKQLKKVFF